MRDIRTTRLYTSLVVVVGTQLFASFYDDILYPLAIAIFGPLSGGVGMSLLAVLLNFLLVYWYRRSEADWFGFEAERRMELEEALNRASKSNRWRLGKFVGLSIDDPSVAFMYYRGHGEGMKMNQKDWGIFFLANTIGISVWLGLLLAVYYSGGYFSEKMADGVMYAFSAYGLAVVLWTIVKKQRVTSR